MAGVKGKSGGARANTGGARPGAGRKPKPRQMPAVSPGMDMLSFLQDVAMGLIDATPTQVKAAVAAVQYTHAKRGDGGKREEVVERSKKAATGKFAPAAPPLRVVRGDQ